MAIRLTICAALAVAILAVYAQVRHFDFVDYDDSVYVLNNDHVMGDQASLIRIVSFWEMRLGPSPPDACLRRSTFHMTVCRGRFGRRSLRIQSGKERLRCSIAPELARLGQENRLHLFQTIDHGDLPIDNNATERAIRGVAVGRNNWVFFGSDEGGETAAVLRSFVASCQRVGADPLVWLKDILSRIADHHFARDCRASAPQLGASQGLIPKLRDGTGQASTFGPPGDSQ